MKKMLVFISLLLFSVAMFFPPGEIVKPEQEKIFSFWPVVVSPAYLIDLVSSADLSPDVTIIGDLAGKENHNSKIPNLVKNAPEKRIIYAYSMARLC